MIFINKVYLDDKNFSKNLIGDLLIKNNKVNNLKLTSDFENNGKFKIEIKTLKNKKKLHYFILTMQNLLLNIFHLLKVLKRVELIFFQLKKKIILIQIKYI